MLTEHLFRQPVSLLVRQRYSCRTHDPVPINPEDLSSLTAFINQHTVGPFGNVVRCKIVAAAENDRSELSKLGTYGFIKDPAGFIIGIVNDRPYSLEDFGYLLELYILRATEIGIGTCWLGGSFTKSRFARISDLSPSEIMPSVISMGYPANQKGWLERIARIYIGADRRLPWEEIFFSGSLDSPLNPIEAGEYQEALEMLRLAPSASNKQPWRIIKVGDDWQFYLKRSRRYPSLGANLIIGMSDLQRVDMGIAMAHFELSAREGGLNGSWIVERDNPMIEIDEIEYLVTWREDGDKRGKKDL